MSPFAEQFTTILADVALVSHVFLVIIIIVIFTQRENPFMQYVKRNALLIGFLVALIGVIASLTYSNIIGISPCTLCWYQRIFLYPQVLIAGIALIKKDAGVMPYLLVFSALGLVVALYQVFYQFTSISLIECSTSGIDCSHIYFMKFNYITIPVLSATLFAYLTVIYTVALNRRNG